MAKEVDFGDRQIREGQDDFPRASRWREVVPGLLLAPFVVLSGLGALAMVGGTLSEGRILGSLLAIILLLVCVWALGVTWRLITGRHRRDGGLVSPTVLGLSGILFIALPLVAALATDWHLRNFSGWAKLAQALLYFAIGGGLLVLRKKRLKGDF